jgi:hypothetical protein
MTEATFDRAPDARLIDNENRVRQRGPRVSGRAAG